MGKIKMFDVKKIKIQQIIKENFNVHMNEEQIKSHSIKQQDTLLFRQLEMLRNKESDEINELIFVEAKHNKKRKPDLEKLLKEGFMFNDKLFVRYGKSSSQAKDGITVFIDNDFYEDMMKRSQLDLEIDKCVVSKYESYRNLILSSCQIVEEKELPYIIIVDEYKKSIENQNVRYAITEEVEYIDTNTKEKNKYKKRVIKEGVTDVDVSPFDGFGVHTKEISEKFNKHISNKHDSVLFQIRLPFMKGVTIETDFKSFYKDKGIAEIVDVFGKSHKVENIDCIWNISMWKGFGNFKKEFGEEGWNEYLKRVNKYGYKIGISKYSHHTDELNIYSRLNFQYLQCLDLMNPMYLQQYKEHDKKYDILDEKNHGKMINVAKYSTELVEKIIKGDKLYTLKFLGVNDTTEDDLKSKYIEAILINDSMLKDPSIKKMLKRKLDKTITQFKYGKIYASGFYHTVVGDIIGYLEYCGGLNVVGCLKYGEFYAKTLPNGDCLSMRSPLVDPSEVNKIKIVENDDTAKYLSHFENQDICMINLYDLTMQQQGGMDEDGDSVFLCNDEILIKSKIDRPIVVDMDDKQSSDAVKYNIDSIVKYEMNSRDNRIGEITNIATSILNQYTENPKWKKINEDNISLLRLYQGKEIDFVKTGFRWIISKNLRKYLKKLPYFLLYNYPKKLNVYNRIREINNDHHRNDRIEYNAFRSPSAMNELCDYINHWERKKIDWDRSLINNGHLLIDKELEPELKNRTLERKIKYIYDKFSNEFRNITDDKEKINELKEKYKNKLNELLLDENLLANFCIKVAYKSVANDKTLCWMLYGDVMIENLKANSDERKELKIVKTNANDLEASEFLGKYYKLVNVNEE